MALTKGQTAIIKMIYASEVDYKIIKDRAEAIRVKTVKTSDEERILADYDKKLQHDDEVIGKWIEGLKKEGVDFASKEVTDLRTPAIEAFIAMHNLKPIFYDVEKERVSKAIVVSTKEYIDKYLPPEEAVKYIEQAEADKITAELAKYDAKTDVITTAETDLKAADTTWADKMSAAADVGEK